MRSKRIVSALLGAVLAFAAVPPAALAEGAREAQGIVQGLEGSGAEVEQSAANKLKKALADANGALEARTRLAGEDWPQEWPEPETTEADAGAQAVDVDADAANDELAGATHGGAATDAKGLAGATRDGVLADSKGLVGGEAAAEAGTEEEAARAFVDLQMRVAKDQRETHDVWYRIHTQDGWLDWTSNGASAGERDGMRNEADVDDVEVLYMSKAQAQKFGEASFDVAAIANDEVAEGEATANEVTDASAKESSQQQGEVVVAQKDDEEAVAEAQATVVPTISYRVHAQTYGWMNTVTNGAMAGTEGEAKRLEAISISLPQGTNGGISYQVHAQTYGWMDEVSNGAMAGTQGEAKRLEAIRIRLTGEAANKFDVWYRVHVQSYGWADWVKDGAMAGTQGEAKRLEAIQIMLVNKGGQAPAVAGDVAGADVNVRSAISYRANVEGFGWMGWVQDGDTAGSTGISAKLLGFSASLAGIDDSELHYAAHVQTYGWEAEATGGEAVGRPDEGKRLEAIRMRLSGAAAQNFDIYYRCHIQSFGWLSWASNNAEAGSAGFGKRIEAIQVVLVPKGSTPPAVEASRGAAFISVPTLRYRGHVQTYGWMDWVGDGELVGTTGESKRVEGLQAYLSDSGLTGEIRMNAHVQSYGWLGWVGEGELAGTTGEGKRVEAFQVTLTGEIANMYDVWYRVHAQKIGWMGWASNGQSAGTQYLSLRLEAVQIRLVPKGSGAPGSTEQPFLDGRYISKLGYQNPPGYYQVSSKNVSITSAAQWPWNYVTPSRIGVWASRGECVETFVQRAAEYIGSPYMWNYSCAPGVGVDCIGLVYQCAYACGMDLGGGTGDSDFNPWAHYITGNSGWHSHDAENFWNYGDAIHVPLSERRRGDVISWPGHVAVYLGNDEIIEAYTSVGVIYNSLWAHGTPRGCIRLFQD